MRTETSLVAEQVRLQQWANLIRECQNRPADLNVDTWCRQHGIAKANYYYRLRRVRQAILARTPNPGPEQERNSCFVELPAPTILPAVQPSAVTAQESKPLGAVAVVHGVNGISVDIFSNTSSDMLRSIVEALAHA